MVYPRFGPDGARVGRESVVNLAQWPWIQRKIVGRRSSQRG